MGNVLRKATLMVLSIIASPVTGVMAQGYEGVPFVEEGKQWYYGPKGIDPEEWDETPYLYSYLLRGDTLISGQKYKKVYRTTPDDQNGEYHAGLREVGGRVYAVKKGCQKDSLLYDFSLKYDQRITYENGVIARVTAEYDMVGYDGKLHKVLHVTFTIPWDGPQIIGFQIWYEGAGIVDYDLFDYKGWKIQEGWFKGCYVNDMCVLPSDPGSVHEFLNDGWEEWERRTNVRMVTKDENIKHPIFDLQGRRVTGQPRRGVYIQNGRKRLVKD